MERELLFILVHDLFVVVDKVQARDVIDVQDFEGEVSKHKDLAQRVALLKPKELTLQRRLLKEVDRMRLV